MKLSLGIELLCFDHHLFKFLIKKRWLFVLFVGKKLCWSKQRYKTPFNHVILAQPLLSTYTILSYFLDGLLHAWYNLSHILLSKFYWSQSRCMKCILNFDIWSINVFFASRLLALTYFKLMKVNYIFLDKVYFSILEFLLVILKKYMQPHF